MTAVGILASVDIIARHLDRAPGRLELMVIQRGRVPFEGLRALQSVLVNGRCSDPSLDVAAIRALNEKARCMSRLQQRAMPFAIRVANP